MPSKRADGNTIRVLTYLYDDIGRLLQVSGNDGSYVKTSYDELDKSTDLHYKFNGQRRDVYFNYYNMDNLPLDVKFGTDSKYIVENNYDELTRLKFKTYTLGSGTAKINMRYFAMTFRLAQVYDALGKPDDAQEQYAVVAEKGKNLYVAQEAKHRCQIKTNQCSD